MSETLTEQAVLSDAQIAEFQRRGVLIVDLGLDPALLDAIREKVYPYYPEEYRKGEVSLARVQDAWKQIDEARQLAVNSRALLALEQLYGRRALAFQTLNFPVGTTQLAHSDTIHFSTIPNGYMAGIWVALEDIDADNGPLVYYPGSHKLPYYGMHDFDLEPGYHNYHIYEQRIQDLISERQLEPEYGTVSKGEAIIWHANLLHGGAPQNDPQRSRHSQVTHYYFEGCKYYTPMESTAEKFTFRDPVWIPETADFRLPEDESINRRIWRRIARRLGLRS